ncbi:metallophosphoesterase family protein [Limimaricola cinnabarinus]|mgnify:CR=1 FL=1|uniref:Phosphoesterase n=1 Tax=Limimaricola cinnabarinus LL-001 TaxID=1337093 RepID=U3AE37_9RHOB|nr:metallophosphoesterase family protein [Limimaricola cinnabarinus]GAD55934.1 phosphoesterase, putative [Limimaricola cinnabarinus LL-001]
MMRIGVISDTHGLLRPEAIAALAGTAGAAPVDHILHGGDIGREEIVDALERIAPVTAIRGNIDTAGWCARFPETVDLDLGGLRIHMRHDRKTLDFDAAAPGIDVVISGHSHRPLIETSRDVLYLNPGSAGPRRFKLPITLAFLQAGQGAPRADLCTIID